jgi:hypothetical protein
MFIIIVIVVIVAVASVGAFYALSSGIKSASSTTSTTTSSVSSSPQTSTTSVTASSSTSIVTSSSTGSASLKEYTGTFNFSLPLGPSGERVFSNDTVQTYGSTQVASGSFSFFINPAADNQSGSGSGHGTIKITTTGFCSGSATVPYTFTLTATTILGNLTIFDGAIDGGAASMNVTIPLSCSGPMNGVNTATNDPVPFLPTYPNEITVASLPANVETHLSGNITYGYDIVETN